MSSPSGQVHCGSFFSTGANKDIDTLPGRPRAIHGHIGGLEFWWQEGMADASMYKRLANGTGSKVTTGGVTPRANGFRLGADTDINPASATLIEYTAWF